MLTWTPCGTYDGLVTLTNNELSTLSQIDTAINDNMAIKLNIGNTSVGIGTISDSNSGGISPMYLSTEHNAITLDSCNKVQMPYASTAASAAIVPDNWAPTCPDWVPSSLVPFIVTVCHGYDHYYDPYLLSGIGGAPDHTNSYAQTARTEFVNGAQSNAATDLGYSSHYLVDVGCPLHTGVETSQWGAPWVHVAYEETYVNGNWGTGWTFSNSITNNNGYYSVTSPSNAAISLSKYTNQYCGTVFDTIYNNPNTYQTNGNLAWVTRNSLTETSRYTIGLVHFVMYGN